MTTILPNSASVREAISNIFRAPGKRVAISAFVGDGAEAYLPKPKGIRLVCWPKAGGTNPDALRKLKKLGVKVQFADNLHMKVYWSKKGAVVTSANLSTNALGSGNLREFGVLLPADEIVIDDVLKTLRIRPFNSKELRELDRKTEAVPKGFRSGGKPMTYAEWHSLPARRDWRIGWCTENADFSRKAKEIAWDMFGRKSPHTMVQNRANSYREGDYILAFFWTSKEKKPREFEWVYADRVVRIGKNDKTYSPDDPCQAVQVFPPRFYQPPFVIDRVFTRAFEKAIQDVGYRKMETRTNTKPTTELVESIAHHYRRLAKQ